MSSWPIGADYEEVVEKTQALKNQLSGKDTECASLQTQLIRRNAELEELRNNLRETLLKLNHEAQRALQLEGEFKQSSEDLKNEKLVSENLRASLATANRKLKASELATKELEVSIETMSKQSSVVKSQSVKLQREKSVVESRVRELELNARQMAVKESSSPGVRTQNRGIRPRSSSINPGLQHELSDARALLSKKETDLRLANEKLSRVQTDLTHLENEKAAMEKRMQEEVRQKEAYLEEKQEEIEYLKARQREGSGGAGEREEALLQRIDEDDAKIEMLLRHQQDAEDVREALRRAERKLQVEVAKVEESETRQADLVQEKEETLDRLEETQSQIHQLTQVVREDASRIQALTQHAATLREQLVQAQNRTDELETELRQTTLEGDIAPSSSGSMSDQPAEANELHPVRCIEQLLVSNERLRGERDGFRADLSFLEAESKFALEAMETKLSALSPHNKDLDDLKEEFANMTARYQEVLSRKEKNVQRLGLITTASVIIIQHLRSQVLSANNQSTTSSQIASIEAQLERANSACLVKDQKIVELDNKASDLEMRCKVTSLDLDAAAAQRTKLFAQIKRLEANEVNLALEARRVKDSQTQMQDVLGRMKTQVLKDRQSLEGVESQRDALVLQVNGLQSDLDAALQQLNEAQDRYSTLQARQLSSISSGEVTSALREQIKELEARILRRTEQIGIHQHDIRRLEVNLRLQEDRVGEMTAELEMSAAEKAAMVEDCADAREARDEALQKVEWLEVEVEVREDQLADVAEQLAQRSEELVTMVELLMGSIGRVRNAETTALRHSRNREELEQRLQDAQAGYKSVLTDLEQLRNEHQKMVLLLGEKNSASKASEHHPQILDSDLTQMTLSFSVSQVDLRASNIAKAGLEKRVTTLENDLETLDRRHTNTTTENDSIFTTRILDLEAKLQEAYQETSTMVKKHQDVVRELHQRLDENEQSSRRQLDAASLLRAQLEEELRAGREELERLSAEFEEMRKRGVDLEERCHQLAISRADTEELLRHTSAEMSQNKEDLAAKQVEFNELSLRLEQLEEKCTFRLDEINQLQVRLDRSSQALRDVECKMLEEASSRIREKERTDKELRCMKERYQHGEEVQLQLQAQIKNSFEELEAVRLEKETIQMNMTTLEAEIQRSLSLRRFLESQMKDNENKITSLTEAVDRTRAELIKAENAAATSQVSLTFQKAEHEKVLSALREEIAVLRSRPNLEPMVAEMERKNLEMEQLLRNKCEEVEENDDRFIELLKEKKKLTSKIESLSLKVLGLQQKLADAKAAKGISYDNIYPPASRVIPPTAMPSHPNSSTTTRQTIFSTGTSNRVTSVTSLSPDQTEANTPGSRVRPPSALPRPKTPERKSATPPFKPRTPDRHALPSASSEPTLPATSSGFPGALIGKKRPPEEFGSLPAQGFTAESLPADPTPSTPRQRKVLQGHSGFTPTRHNSARPTIPLPSPRRKIGLQRQKHIADVTNSPHLLIPAETELAKPTKQTWLGKIRGAPSQPFTWTSSRPDLVNGTIEGIS